MLFIKEDPRKIEGFYKLINKSGLGDELYLISCGGNDAFLCATPRGASALAMQVTVQGDDTFDQCCVLLANGRKYFVEAATNEGFDITIEIPIVHTPGHSRYDPYVIRNAKKELYPYEGSHFTSEQNYAFISNTQLALSGELPRVGKIRLPNRIGRGNGAVFDLLNHRYGICKETSSEFNYLFSEVRDLDVEEGKVVACYHGSTAAVLPWKKGLEAEVYKYPSVGCYDFCVIRYVWNDYIILLMPANTNNDEVNYVGVFGEDMPEECRCANETF